jgi:hypothetical protein
MTLDEFEVHAYAPNGELVATLRFRAMSAERARGRMRLQLYAMGRQPHRMRLEVRDRNQPSTVTEEAHESKDVRA